MTWNNTLVASALLIASSFATGASASLDDDTLRIVGTDGALIAEFTQDEVEAIGTTDLVTSTPWTDGEVSFTGVKGKELLATVGVSEVDIMAIALDDYAAKLSWADLVEHDPLFATQMNGERLSVGSKGPFWIVFDFDELDDSAVGELSSKAVWHMFEIEIE